MKRILFIVLFVFSELYSFDGFSQNSSVYSTIETKDVIYYSVEEIVNMKFGGTTTRYVVSDLNLISKSDLGPDNIRIITPIYKNEKFNNKKYYIETKNLTKGTGINQKPTNITEIKIDSKKIDIPDNQNIGEESLAVAILNITKTTPEKIVKKPVVTKEPVKIVNTAVSPKVVEKVVPKAAAPKVKSGSIVINVIETYERVADKGFKSIYIFKELGNNFYFKNDLVKAVKFYEELFEMTTDLDPVFYFRYGDALKKTGKVKKGEALIEKFNKLSED